MQKSWTDMIDRAVGNPKWDVYDGLLVSEVLQYNKIAHATADWKLFKALLWTESGADSPAWKTRPMQIGNKGDPAYDVLKAGKERSNLIMPDSLKADLAADRSINDPVFNIQCGLAYAYTKLSNFGTQVTNNTILSDKLHKGEGLQLFAKRVGTTEQNVRDNNSGNLDKLREGQLLKFQLATVQPLSCTIDAFGLQKRYNAGGDSQYAAKLTYCYNLILLPPKTEKTQ